MNRKHKKLSHHHKKYDYHMKQAKKHHMEGMKIAKSLMRHEQLETKTISTKKKKIRL